jgi:heme exporter protein B
MPHTGSNWLAEAAAVFAKEAKVEARTKHGLASALLFGVGASLASALGSVGQSPTPSQAAAALGTLLLLNSVVALPRTFLAEADHGTFDLLRLHGSAAGVFVGKAAWTVVQGSAFSAVAAVLYLLLAGVQVADPVLACAAVVLASAGFSIVVSACGALSLSAEGRYGVAAATALPMLLPPLMLVHPALVAALVGGPSAGGWRAAAGLAGWALATAAAAVPLAAAAWRLAHDDGGGA